MIQIRSATPQDVRAIQALIQPYFADFVVDESGLAHFSEQVVMDFIHHSEVHSFVAEQDQQILGVVAYREPAHLLHFFVDQHHHAQGIGKQLWQYAEQHALQQPIQEFTVNSSCAAQEVYRRFGFEAVQDVKEAHGLRFIAMKKTYPTTP
ncbi:GNAT family N-acetyltransferase [Acinetobacter sp. ANC 4636]|uniref:GNAT family N-acetyltransferase n=1 Tax=Acinetobacter sp. ANC 4635 TaxID=2529846 RepID=UPI001038B9E8|nr:GNAT family N-acetyltransferase [Acinetobacter sp. ANC 4635]TCB32706.1 GNAT family N-acetyltransferase [Acinetobacter sp. ANC 4635]